MLRLAPLHLPKKPVGMASQTGTVKIGESPGDEATREDLHKLSKDTSQLLTVGSGYNILSSIHTKFS